MKSAQLTPENIERLYRFTREHYVEWYDLQTELVDHLANAIETEWQENPSISFEDALQKEFRKFGVFGFMDVVEKRQIALNRKYGRIVWKHFKEFLTFPKIALSIVFTGLLYWLQHSTDAQIIRNILFVAILAMALVQIIRNVRFQNRKARSDEKRWLFNEVIRSYGNLGIFFMLPIQLLGNIWRYDNVQNNLSMVLMSVFFVAYFLVFYIILFVIPSKAEAYLEETYPEYLMEKL